MRIILLNKNKNISSFTGIIEYNFKQEKNSEIIYSNLVSEIKKECIEDFNSQAKLSNIKNKGFHISISFSPNDKKKLEDTRFKTNILNEILTELNKKHKKLNKCQLMLIEHKDQPHPHFHLVINKVSTAVNQKNKPIILSDSNIIFNCAEIGRKLTIKHDLYFAPTIQDKQTNEEDVKENKTPHQEEQTTTNNIEKLLLNIYEKSTSLNMFFKELEKNNIEFKIKKNQYRHIEGLSIKINNDWVSTHRINRILAIKNLISHYNQKNNKNDYSIDKNNWDNFIKAKYKLHQSILLSTLQKPLFDFLKNNENKIDKNYFDMLKKKLRENKIKLEIKPNEQTNGLIVKISKQKYIYINREEINLFFEEFANKNKALFDAEMKSFFVDKKEDEERQEYIERYSKNKAHKGRKLFKDSWK